MSKKQSRNNTPTQQASDESPVVDVEVTQKEEVVEEETTTEANGENEEKSPYEIFREEHSFAERWNDGDIDLWKDVMGNRPTFVDDDVLPFDPYRDKRPVNQWSTAELKAYLSGKLLRVTDSIRKDVANEYRNRVEIPDAWSDIDMVSYFTHDRTPPKTDSGVWLRDITRDRKAPSSWTDDELKAWMNEEIKSDIPSQKITNEFIKRFDLDVKEGTIDKRTVKKAFVEDRKRVEDINQTIAKGQLTPMNKSFIESTLDQYVKTVALGKPVSDQQAANSQNQLEALFTYVTNLEGAGLIDSLNMINKAFVDHRDTVFNPNHVHRFTHFVKGDSKVKSRHTNMLELFATVASPNKAQRKQVDYRMMLREFPEAKAEMLHDYFKNYA